MRIILGLLIVVAIAGGVITHQQRARSSDAPAKTETPAPHAEPKEPSEHNWPKSALDRAADVKRQVAAQKKSNAADE